MLKVGITGGIGSGKSIVCRLFSLLGIPIYDSDLRAKWVMQHDLVLRENLIRVFGDKTFAANQLDRAYLGKIVFNDPERLALLNSLVHPRVKADFEAWSLAQQNVPYIIKEAALMYETEAHKQVGKMILVSAPVPIRIRRVQQRDPHRQASDIRSIIKEQLPEEELAKRVDFIMQNDDQQLVIPQVIAIHQQLLHLL